MTTKQVEQAGTYIYRILKSILQEESLDTLEVVEDPLTWDDPLAVESNKDLLKEIESGYTFTKRTTPYQPQNAYPTFYYNLGTYPKDDKSMKLLNKHWKLKKHEYSFQDFNGKQVEIKFFSAPKTLPIRTVFKTKDGVSMSEYFAEISYQPKNKDERIASGNASFEIESTTGFTKLRLNKDMIGKEVSLNSNSMKLVDMTEDFAVLEAKGEFDDSFRIITISETDKRYKLPSKKGVTHLYGGKSSKVSVNKLVWEYVEGVNYQIEKEPFLAWFATNFFTKLSEFSKEEMEEMYVIIYCIGEMESAYIYKNNVEKLAEFKMEL